MLHRSVQYKDLILDTKYILFACGETLNANGKPPKDTETPQDETQWQKECARVKLN